MVAGIEVADAVGVLAVLLGDSEPGGDLDGGSSADLCADLCTRDTTLETLAACAALQASLAVVGVMLLDRLSVWEERTPQEILREFGADLAAGGPLR